MALGDPRPTTERIDPSTTVLPEGGLPAVREAKPAIDVTPGEASRPPAPIPQETVKNIASAIAAVTAKVGVVSKHGVNQFHRYKYAAMQDILQKLTPLLAKHGLAIMQTEINRSMFDSDRVIAIQYAFTIIHTSGEVWPERLIQSGMSRCRDSRGGFDDKALNKCHTAARKYMLLALFQIATGEEDDADADKIQSRPIPRHDPDGVILDDELPDDLGPPIRPPAPRPNAAAADRVDAPRAPSTETSAGASAETLTERLMRLDQELTVAAENGTEELRRAWLLIPPKDRPALEAALRNRHKPRAAEVDAAKQP